MFSDNNGGVEKCVELDPDRAIIYTGTIECHRNAVNRGNLVWFVLMMG